MNWHSLWRQSEHEHTDSMHFLALGWSLACRPWPLPAWSCRWLSRNRCFWWAGWMWQNSVYPLPVEYGVLCGLWFVRAFCWVVLPFQYTVGRSSAKRLLLSACCINVCLYNPLQSYLVVHCPGVLHRSVLQSDTIGLHCPIQPGNQWCTYVFGSKLQNMPAKLKWQSQCRHTDSRLLFIVYSEPVQVCIL